MKEPSFKKTENIIQVAEWTSRDNVWLSAIITSYSDNLSMAALLPEHLWSLLLTDAWQWRMDKWSSMQLMHQAGI